MLALAPQHALHREPVMEQLWPQQSPTTAAKNLHQVLHFARRALAGATRSHDATHRQQSPVAYLEVRQQVIRLQPVGRVWVDVHAFEQAAKFARHQQNALAYEKALALYEGDLLPESPYDEMFAESRRKLSNLHLALQLEKAALDEAAGSWKAALDTYRRILTNDATVEAAVAGLLRSCGALGARDEAARYFAAYISQIQNELDLEPDPELKRLFDTVTAGGSAVVAPSPVMTDTDTGDEIASDRGAVVIGTLPLVGRDRELHIVSAALRNTQQGTIFVVTGEPGIGKSHLIREVCRQASEAGLRTALGFGAGPGETETPPFGPWRQVLHEYSARTGRSGVGLPPPLGNGPRSVSTQELALDVAEFLITGPPAVIVFEDVHWFDAASIDMLRLALPRFRHSPVHMLLSCRSQYLGPDSHLRSLSESLLGIAATWLELEPLSRAGIETLAGLAGRPEQAGIVYERSGGNPFFAAHLLAATGTELPWTIRQAIAERLHSLRGSSLSILRVAALLGTKFEAGALQGVVDLSQQEVDHALADALEKAIVRRSGNAYAFAHDLWRQSLLESIPQHERMQLHRRAAAIVSDPDAAAYHLGEIGDPQAVPALVEAARRAMQWGALEHAHRYLERALHLAAPNDPLRWEIMLLLAVRNNPDQVAAQHQRLQAVIGGAEKCGDFLVAGLARRLLAEILFMRNDERALDVFDQSLADMATAGDDPRSARLETLVANRILMYPGLPTLMHALLRHKQGGDAAAVALEMLSHPSVRTRSSEDRLAAAFALMINGEVLGAVDGMVAGGERAMAVRSYVTATWCFATAVNLCLWQCGTERTRIESIVGRMREAAERARERMGVDPFPGDNYMLPYWYWYGQWDRVRRVYDVFVDAGGTLNGTVAGFGYVYGAEVIREQGEPYHALRAYAALLPPAGPGSKPGLIHYLPQMAYITLAVRTMIAAGEFEMARAWLKTVDSWHQGPRPSPVNHAWTLIEWAEWHRAQGNLDAMRNSAMAALKVVRGMPARWVECNAHRLLGAAGGSDSADNLARAIDLAERCGFPLEIARARLERGRGHDLQIARRIFEQLGAKPYLKRLNPSTAQS